mmetsp:Transcript_65342/g.206449  ORF Transcript_65342/g.206449 Transcript_65342/m.206449 type:complete len:112 (+) Transcript_65342:3-338(+)
MMCKTEGRFANFGCRSPGCTCSGWFTSCYRPSLDDVDKFGADDIKAATFGLCVVRWYAYVFTGVLVLSLILAAALLVQKLRSPGTQPGGPLLSHDLGKGARSLAGVQARPP